MVKGTTLRVPEGLELSAEYLAVLEHRFPNYVLERFSEIPDYKRSYQKRVDSIYAAFRYLLDAYPWPLGITPLTQETIRNAVDEYKATYDGTGESLNELQDELRIFTTKVIDIISLVYGKTGSEATELLNQAEQYALLVVGRNDLVTITPANIATHPEIKFFLQVDEFLPPYNKKIIDELSTIKTENYPKTPRWFHNFAAKEHHYKQAYFCNLSPEHLDVKRDFSQFLLMWGRIKDTASDLMHDLLQIDKDVSPLPAWFQTLPLHQQEMVKLLSQEWSVSMIDSKLHDLHRMIIQGQYQSSLANFIKIPQWYWDLSEHQQYFLEHLLKNKSGVEEAISVLSSRHRRLPMLANWGVHSLWWLKDEGGLQAQLQRVYDGEHRSSHSASRDDIKYLPDAVQQRHVLGNLSRIITQVKPSQKVALVQTLVSPVEFPYLSHLLPEFPDAQLDKMARSVIKKLSPHFIIIRTNHPLNIAKYSLYTAADDESSLQFISVLEQYLAHVPGLDDLLSNYKGVLNSGVFTATLLDYSGRELFLSTLEQLLIEAIGGFSYGSCVSGKDRKAIEMIHSDAMRIYNKNYGVWPQFQDTESNRARFVSIVADLFVTHHHEELAGLNAPGSEGIKTPSIYFPGDICAEINKRLKNPMALSWSDKLASNNEIRVISKGSPGSVENTLRCQLVATQLGEEKCTELYQALLLIVGQKSLFVARGSAKWWPSIPSGIQQIMDLMNTKDAAKTRVMRMAKIFSIVLQRNERDSSRTLATQTIYSDIRGLLFNQGDESDLVEKILRKWHDLFDQSKRTYLRAC